MANGPTAQPPTAHSRPPAHKTAAPAAATLLRPSPPPGAHSQTPEPAHALIPRWLYTGGAWSWRLIVIGVVAYFVLHFILKIQLVVLPFLGAMVFTALLRPVSLWLQRHGF